MKAFRTEIFIGGELIPAHSTHTIDLVSPVTEEVFGKVPDGDETDVDRAVRSARRALPGWRALDPKQRAEFLHALANAYERRAPEIADIVAASHGAPQWYARKILTVAARYRSAAIKAEALEIEEFRDGGRTLMRSEPLGVIGIIVPWNAPQHLLAARVGPALAAGCAVVVKPSPETTLADYLFTEIVQAAGIPDGVINIVPGGRETGAQLVRHPGTDKIAFVGSVSAARDIASAAGSLLKPVNAELGGKSAAILLEDADLDLVGDSIVEEFLPFSGQVCYSLTRVIAPRSRYDEVLECFATRLAECQVGDPADPATIFGPLISGRQRDRVMSYIEQGMSDGAVPLIGGQPSTSPRGYFVEPTIFDHVNRSMSIFREEIFGPVLVMMPYDTEAEAIEIANDSSYGLSGAVFSRDVSHATDIARQLETARVLVNAAWTGFLGGHKESGLERDSGLDPIAGYQQVKGISQPVSVNE